MLVNTVIYWSPGSTPESEAAYCDVIREWFPEHETTPQQIAAERRYVQEQCEAQAEKDGHDFLLVRATPRFMRAELAKFGVDFTIENVHRHIRMLAELPGFNPEHLYDIES